MKILLVDDETAILEEIALELQENGHEVTTAKDGSQGFDLYSSNPQAFDLVLTDVKMPVMDGLELLREVKKEDPEMPVMIMTGHGDMSIAINALKLGALDFIVKPFRLETLRSLSTSLSRIHKLYSSKQKALDIFPYIEPIRIRIPSQTDLISSVVAYFQSSIEMICKQHKAPSHGIYLSLYEAIANGIVHGNLEISSDLKEASWNDYEQLLREREASPKFGARTVTIQYQGTEEQICFEIEDQGAGFDYTHLPDFKNPENFLCSGRGIALISVYMDEISWNPSGNRMRMIKYFEKEVAP